MNQNITDLDNPLVSIITVVYNDYKGLEKTIQSIINQTYPNIEYIIIDGGSTDGTLDTIKAYEKSITYWVSEKDNGIYNAMNKGIKVAKGKWINFMNAGDTFYEKTTLQTIFEGQNYDDVVLIYGNKYQDGENFPPLPLKSLDGGEIMGCHQSMFFNKVFLMDELYYDLKYKIYADYELVFRLYRKYNRQFFYVNTSIATYEGEGISTQYHWLKRKEKYTILFKEKGFIGITKGIYHRIKKQFKGDDI